MLLDFKEISKTSKPPYKWNKEFLAGQQAPKLIFVLKILISSYSELPQWYEVWERRDKTQDVSNIGALIRDWAP